MLGLEDEGELKAEREDTVKLNIFQWGEVAAPIASLAPTPLNTYFVIKLFGSGKYKI